MSGETRWWGEVIPQIDEIDYSINHWAQSIPIGGVAEWSKALRLGHCQKP